jgi:hypothetical protein
VSGSPDRYEEIAWKYMHEIEDLYGGPDNIEFRTWPAVTAEWWWGRRTCQGPTARSRAKAQSVQLLRNKSTGREKLVFVLHQPETPTKLYEWLHECGHVFLDHVRNDGPASQQEYEAERWAAQTMEREGVPVPPRTIRAAKSYVNRFVKQELRAGETVSPKIIQWVNSNGRTNPTPPVTDRALRYRANRTPPASPRRCLFCGARKVQVGHLDGHEENNAPKNLVWTCRSCNTKMGVSFRRRHAGRRTRQYNPAGGAQSSGAWMNAIASLKGEGGDMTVTDAVALIHSTPQADRHRFSKEFWERRYARYGPSGRSETVPF